MTSSVPAEDRAVSKFSVNAESFKPLRSGTLFADILIPELHMRIPEATVHEGHGKRRVGCPPSRRSAAKVQCAAMSAARLLIVPSCNPATGPPAARSRNARLRLWSKGFPMRSLMGRGLKAVRDLVETRWMRKFRGEKVFPRLSYTFMNTRSRGRRRPHFLMKRCITFGGGLPEAAAPTLSAVPPTATKEAPNRSATTDKASGFRTVEPSALEVETGDSIPW
jgi:hypothetical protein